jgi:2,4-dienoyl-CoA reductase-like NADH-dependent reductase (Old Yellow Enzyme family)
MSALFSPLNLGAVQIRNRFVHSATYEAMASETGEVTEGLVMRYRNLSKGEVGLIIPGCMHVHPLGRRWKHRLGIHFTEGHNLEAAKMIKSLTGRRPFCSWAGCERPDTWLRRWRRDMPTAYR